MKLEGLSLLFPCHNEELHVDALLRDALQIAPTVASAYEIIIMDDGSTDRTAEKVRQWSASGQPVRLLQHAHRQGYGHALRSGFKAAKMPWIFFSDGDRQFDLQELSGFVERSPETDIVAGYRLRRADPWHRHVNSSLFNAALRSIFNLDIRDVNCAFKLYRREVLDQMTLKSSGALINAEILSKARQRGFKILSLAVTHKPRTAGRPTGAQWRVIGKAMEEFISLRQELRKPHGKA